jgi:hypothetical protein
MLSAVAIGSGVLFFEWCILDYFLVHSANYPGNSGNFDWLIFIFPTSAWLLCYVTALSLGMSYPGVRSAVATVISIPIAVVLIFQFGIPFHFPWGGRL